ncbi:MAG: hypothetical protein ACRELB_15095, partial [Polyangiaceae bacterium]
MSAEEKKAKGEQHAKPAGDKADKGKGGGDKGKGGGKKKGNVPAASPSQASVTSNTPPVPPRLLDKYKDTVIPALTKQFNYKNPNQVPRLQKIVVNMG